MNLTSSLRRLVVLTASALLALSAHAHSKLDSATPKSGSTLDSSPASIELKFKDAVRLTSVVLAQSGGERKLAFTPNASAQQFSIAKPGLASGRNELRWTALSRDGHVIEGVVVYVIAPTAKGQ